MVPGFKPHARQVPWPLYYFSGLHLVIFLSCKISCIHEGREIKYIISRMYFKTILGQEQGSFGYKWRDVCSVVGDSAFVIYNLVGCL